MSKATHATTTPRGEPEVLAAQVAEMLGPFFKGDIDPTAVEAVHQRPKPFGPASSLAALADTDFEPIPDANQINVQTVVDIAKAQATAIAMAAAVCSQSRTELLSVLGKSRNDPALADLTDAIAKARVVYSATVYLLDDAAARIAVCEANWAMEIA